MRSITSILLLLLITHFGSHAQFLSQKKSDLPNRKSVIDNLEIPREHDIPSFIVITKTTNDIIDDNSIIVSERPINVNSNIGAVECYQECISKSLLTLKLHAGGNLRTIEPKSLPWAGSYGVTFNILCNGSILSGPHTLQLLADKPEETFVLDITEYRNSRCIQTLSPVCSTLTLQITNKTISTSPVVPPAWVSSIRLETRVSESINRTPLANPTVLNTSIVSAAINGNVRRVMNNPVTFQWQESGCSLDSASSFELQVLRLYNTDPTLINNESQVRAIVDWSQAFTLETGTTAKSITLNLGEGRGWYIWRVRPIYDVVPVVGAADSRNWGPYSDAPANSTSSVLFSSSSPNLSGNQYLFFLHDDNNYIHNYSYGKVITEGSTDGPRIAEAMVFADPLLNPVQKHDKIASENGVNVTQTVYDYAGRPIVQTIPSFEQKSNIGFSYISNFISGASGTYGPANMSNGVPGPFLGSNGPSKYYSDNNVLEPLVPSDPQYPFTATQFYPDGRVKASSSGAGSEHSINSSHPITMYYSGVSEKELTSIFGSEAPDPLTCAKVITNDPNGVTSVQYVNKEGKTLATSLKGGLGESDISADQIPVITQAGAGKLNNLVGEKVNWLNGNNKVNHVIRKGVFTSPTELTSSTSLYFDSETQLSLDYTFPSPQSFNTNDCKTCGCDYVTTVKISSIDFPMNPPIDVHTWNNGIAVPPQPGQPTPAVGCGNVTGITNQNYTITLPAGSYLIERTLKTNNKVGLSLSLTTEYLNAIENSISNSLDYQYSSLKSNLFGISLNADQQLQNYLTNKLNYVQGLQLFTEFSPSECPETIELPDPNPCLDLTDNCSALSNATPSGIGFEQYLVEEVLKAMGGKITLGSNVYQSFADFTSGTYAVDINRFFKGFQYPFSYFLSGYNDKYPLPIPQETYYDNVTNKSRGWGIFDLLVWQMIQDMKNAQTQNPPKSMGYTCEDLTESWMETVQRYIVHNTLQLKEASTYQRNEFDLLEEFITRVYQRVGGRMSPQNLSYRKLFTYTNDPYLKNSVPYGYLSNAHYVAPFNYSAFNQPGFIDLKIHKNALMLFGFDPTSSPVMRLDNPWEEPVFGTSPSTAEIITFSRLNYTALLGVKSASTPKTLPKKTKRVEDENDDEDLDVPQPSTCNIDPYKNHITPEEAKCLVEEAHKTIDNINKRCKRSCDDLSETFVYELEKLYSRLNPPQYRFNNPKYLANNSLPKIDEEEFLCRLSLLKADCSRGCIVGLDLHDVYEANPNVNFNLYVNNQIQQLFQITNTDLLKERLLGVFDIHFPNPNGTSCPAGDPNHDFEASYEPAPTFSLINKGNLGITQFSVIKLLTEFLNTHFQNWKKNIPAGSTTSYPLHTALLEFKNIYYPDCNPNSGNPCCTDQDMIDQKTFLNQFISNLSNNLYPTSLYINRITRNNNGKFRMEEGIGNACCKLIFEDTQYNYVDVLAEELNKYLDNVWGHISATYTGNIPMPNTASSRYKNNLRRSYYHIKNNHSNYNYSQLSAFADSLIGKLKDTDTLGTFSNITKFINITGTPLTYSNPTYTYPVPLSGIINTTITDLYGWYSVPDSIPDSLVSNPPLAPPFWMEMGTISIIFPRNSDDEPIRELRISLEPDSIRGDSLHSFRIRIQNGDVHDVRTITMGGSYEGREFFDNFLNESDLNSKGNIFSVKPFTQAIGLFIPTEKGVRFDSRHFPDKEDVTTFGYKRKIVYSKSTIPNGDGFGELCGNHCSLSDCGLCIRWHKQHSPPNNPFAIGKVTYKPCEKRSVEEVQRQLDTRFAEIKAKIIDRLRKNYLTSCGNLLAVNDKVTVSYNDSYHHYTLYFYDRAGNLVRTVPPKGVDINPARDRYTLPSHTYVTHYEYDAKGQLIRSRTPDGGESWFGYDYAGRLVFSQTEEQRSPTNGGAERYTLTLYDDQSRIKSVQEILKVDNNDWWTGFDTPSSSSATTMNFLQYAAQMSLPNRSIPGNESSPQQQVVTIYSDNDNSTVRQLHNTTTQQKYLRNRISKAINYNTSSGSDDVVTIYSYDAHGNVVWTENDLPGLSSVGNKERISYDYDLLSKKVNMVKVRDGKKDRFYQRYIYDQDNRIKFVESSTDTIQWDRDVAYQYYKHGPLKRMVLGEDSVQGIDYVYTINGWIKGINQPSNYRSGTGNPYPHDPGGDGNPASTSPPKTRIPADVFGTMIGYYGNDYVRSGSPFSGTALSMIPPTSSPTSRKDLYNGNIAWWTNRATSNNSPFDASNQNNRVLASVYTYDKLNRLKSDVSGRFSWISNSWNNWTQLGDVLKNTYSYDANGNITNLARFSTASVDPQFDDQTYIYHSLSNGSNRLRKINDNTSFSGRDNSDIDDQPYTTNYYYEKNGNLSIDNDEDIELEWTLSGKVRKVKKYSTSSTKLEFIYDAMGNRVRKRVFDASGTNVLKDVYYTFAPDGKLVQTTDKNGMGTITSVEYPIYGISRVGLYKKSSSDRSDEVTGLSIFPRYTNRRFYEVNDHLGNVRAVVGDAKDWNTSFPNEYLARVSNISNYYPFGMAQPGRMYSTGDYRYGYNGKEEDNEVKGGDGKSLDFGARWYDPRKARWDATDNKESNYPNFSTYSFGLNNPINNVDIDGRVVKDKDGNVVFTKDREGIYQLGGDGKVRPYIKGVYGRILTDQGKELTVFVASSNQIFAKTINNYKEQISGKTIEKAEEFVMKSEVEEVSTLPDIKIDTKMNCTGYALLNAPVFIDSYNVDLPIAKSDNYVLNTGKMKKGDVGLYFKSNVGVIHFEKILSDGMATGKNGIALPKTVEAGKDPEISDFDSYVVLTKTKTNTVVLPDSFVGPLKPNEVRSSGIDTSTSSNGINEVSNSNFNSIKSDVTSPKP